MFRSRTTGSSGNVPDAPAAENSVAMMYADAVPLPLTTGLVILPFFVALLPPLIGSILHTGQEEKHLHKSTFDNFFQAIGTLMPFFPIIIRATANYVKPLPASLDRHSLLYNPVTGLMVQTCIQAARVLVYFLHLLTQEIGIWIIVPYHSSDHIMADHIVLGMAVCAGLGCELAVSAVGLRTLALHTKAPKPQVIRSSIIFGAGLLYTCFLITMVGMNMYKTARYFHDALHSLIGLVIGSALYTPTAWLVFKHCIPMFENPDYTDY